MTPHHLPMSILLLLAATVLPVIASASQATSDGAEAPQALEEVEKALQADQEKAEVLALQRKALRAELRGIRSELVESARKAQDLEDKLSRIEQTLSVLEVEESRARARLGIRRDQMAKIIQGLQRMALLPKESLLLGPGSPLDVARGNLVLQAVLPRIEEEARRLRADLSDLATLRRQIEVQKGELQKAGIALSEEREGLSHLLERKEEVQTATGVELAAARRRAEILSRRAADLRDLIAELEKERLLAQVMVPGEKPRPPEPAAAAQPSVETASPSGGEAENMAEDKASEAKVSLLAPAVPPEDVRPFPGTRGSLVMPARGRLRYGFGDRLPESKAGGNAKGLFLETRPGAQIVAPYDGKVVYAQNFRGYGLILIIEHSGQYHSLLSGFERVDAVEGQWVLAGEPVGVMGEPEAGNPELYLELRRDGRPIDPLPWLAQDNEKVKS